MRIVYFDGLCNVCNHFVDFLIRRDRARRLKFAPLQGATAAAHLSAELRTDLTTMVFEDNGVIYVESSAAIRCIASVGGIYAAMIGFLAVPKFLRDGVYRWVANHRYLFAGRRSTCRLPSAEERAQFLE